MSKDGSKKLNGKVWNRATGIITKALKKSRLNEAYQKTLKRLLKAEKVPRSVAKKLHEIAKKKEVTNKDMDEIRSSLGK